MRVEKEQVVTDLGLGSSTKQTLGVPYENPIDLFANKTLCISDTLIWASFNLSRTEQNIMLMLAGLSNPYNMVEIPARQYAELLGISLGNAQGSLKHAARSLKVKSIQSNLVKDRSRHPIVEHIEYTPEQTLVIKPSQHFTKIATQYYLTVEVDTKLITSLAHSYAQRMFLLFLLAEPRAYLGTNNSNRPTSLSTSYDLDDLKEAFCLADSYKSTSSFRNYVLDAAIDEINTKTNITVYFYDEKDKPMYIYQGKEVVGLCFNLCWI